MERLNRPIEPPSVRSWCTIGSCGTSPTPSDTTTGAASTGTSAASAAGVRCSNTSRGLIFSPSLRARLETEIDRMLSPPSAKKSSSAPTSARPSTAAKMSVSRRSRSSRGPVSAARSTTGSGSAFTSTLPPTVSGSASSTTIALGTIGSGSDPISSARSRSPAVVPAT